MELLQLRYFSALAHNGNLTKTANQLFISPSSMSQTISRLEAELEVKLFDRCNNRMVLNEYGKAFLKNVDAALEEIDKSVETLSKLKTRNQNLITIGVVTQNAFLDCFTEFLKEYPEAVLSHSVVALDDLVNNNSLIPYDFIIASPLDVEHLDLSFASLYQGDHPILLVPTEHPFAKYKEISLQELKNEPFVCLPKGYSSRNYFNHLCRLAGFTPRISIECDYFLREKMVKNGLGVTVVTGHTRRMRHTKGISYIDIVDPVFPREMGTFWSKDKELSDIAVKFIDFAVEYYSQIKWKRNKR